MKVPCVRKAARLEGIRVAREVVSEAEVAHGHDPCADEAGERESRYEHLSEAVELLRVDRGRIRWIAVPRTSVVRILHAVRERGSGSCVQ